MVFQLVRSKTSFSDNKHFSKVLSKGPVQLLPCSSIWAANIFFKTGTLYIKILQGNILNLKKKNSKNGLKQYSWWARAIKRLAIRKTVRENIAMHCLMHVWVLKQGNKDWGLETLKCNGTFPLCSRLYLMMSPSFPSQLRSSFLWFPYSHLNPSEGSLIFQLESEMKMFKLQRKSSGAQV